MATAQRKKTPESAAQNAALNAAQNLQNAGKWAQIVNNKETALYLEMANDHYNYVSELRDRCQNAQTRPVKWMLANAANRVQGWMQEKEKAAWETLNDDGEGSRAREERQAAWSDEMFD